MFECNPPGADDAVTEALLNVAHTMRQEHIAADTGAAALRSEPGATHENPRYYDPESPRDVDFSTRPSFVGEYTFDPEGRPLNPTGLRGVTGRGTLRKWGPNNAADPVVIATTPDTGRRHILLIRRGDTGEWALPGGNVDPGEHVSDATVRELQEETGIDLRELENEVIYEGYVDDPRNTDNAWFETTARLFRLYPPREPQAGDDAVDARWFPCDTLDELRTAIRELDSIDPSAEPIYASHADIIAEALRRL